MKNCAREESSEASGRRGSQPGQPGRANQPVVFFLSGLLRSQKRWGAQMDLWSWVQLVAAALAVIALFVAFAAERRAVACKTRDRLGEAWDQLSRSRLAMLLAALFTVIVITAEYRI